MSARRRVVVAAAVLRERVGAPILLTRRREGDFLGGYWEFPVGKLELGESPEVALVRECEEEIGLTVVVGSILEVAWHAYEKNDVLLLFYDCRKADAASEVRELEVADHAWVSPAELGDYALPPPDMRLVERLRAGG